MKYRFSVFNIFLITFSLFITSVEAQNLYNIDVSQVDTLIRRSQLDLGGTNVNGKTIEVNNFYIERNGKPFIPVIGEFHYSRYPNQYWDEEIRKMKAGGITVIATYIFWNIHEPKEGVFNWEGDLNLRRFIELCKANEMDVIIRIGPFDHGEIRNGGIPDWLYGRPIEIRSNDSTFLNYVKILYNQIAQQVKGLLFKDGGPIIGVQLENEYQHSAAPWAITYDGAPKEYTAANFDQKITQAGVGINKTGNDLATYGQKYMQNLKSIAKEDGLDVPIYTATGWGNATIVKNGSLPVMAAYAYPFWEPGNKPSPFYLFKNIHKNPDYSPVSYVPENYPSIAAELGTGISVTYSRRPRVKGESFLPMMVRMLGSGTNGLGYYMYHGGTTPSKGFFMYSEGSGLNLKSYDYQAPLGEFGFPSMGFYDLKIVNNFLKYYGNKLAPMFPVIPETNATITPQNTTTLRYSVRSNGTGGFLFMHNFQDHVNTSDLNGLQVKIKTKTGEISIPESETFTLKSGASAMLPFNIDFSGVLFKYASVQPLCAFTNNEINYNVFISIDGITPELVLNGIQEVKVKGAETALFGGNIIVKGKNGTTFEAVINSAHFLVIPFQQALNTYMIGKPDDQYLLISDALVLEDGETLQMISMGKELWDLDVYPAEKSIQSINAKVSKITSENLFSHYSIQVNKVIPRINIKQYDDSHFVLDGSNQNFSELNDIYIKFDYRGDRAVCMINGELATDNFYTSRPWLIGLKRYADLLKNNEMYFYFFPMKKDAPYLSYLEKDVIPDFTKSDEFLEIKKLEIIPEYKIYLSIQ